MRSIKNFMQILILFFAPLLLQNCQSLADVIVVGNSANDQIKDLTDPTEAQDATTKAYVDSLFSIMLLLNNGITDYDGNRYDVIMIRDMIWMADNLKTTKYNDGTNIPLVADNTEWSSLTTPAYCWYNNDEENYRNNYGALYNWYTVNTGKLCPIGWHVPRDTEWLVLVNILGGATRAGGKLKEIGTTHWISPNTGATNQIRFTALPGGYHTEFGGFRDIGIHGHWWSATEENFHNAGQLSLTNYLKSAFQNDLNKKNGFSVRCKKD